MRASFSGLSSDFTLRRNLKALELGWRRFNALSANTEAVSGPRPSATKAPLFISHSATNPDRTPAGLAAGPVRRTSVLILLKKLLPAEDLPEPGLQRCLCRTLA